ncbi:MAG: TetR/AcrR family transcriptional regulator [Acidobacteriota bacterium]
MIKDLFNCDHTGRMKGDARREQILKTAVTLFSKRGFSGTTTKEIARAAGVSEAMVFRHFASKDELYGEILADKACQSGMQQVPREADPILKKAIEEKDDYTFFYHLAVRALTKQHADIDFMRLLFFSALEEHELAEKFFADFIGRVYDFIGEYVKQRQDDGALRGLDSRIVVRAFLGMVIHHSLNNILWDKKRNLLDISNEEAAKNFAEIILKGISK